jgi:hypothetical protein
MTRPELKKVKVTWTSTDGEDEFESYCWIPTDGPSTISDMTGQLQLVASDYDVKVEVVDEGAD